MPLDIARLIAEHAGENYRLHGEHVNPRFARVLRTIGFDRSYTRAEGPWLWDGQHRYLDLISGYGVFALGRNHPAIRQSLEEFLRLDYPSLVQMEAPLLSGLLAAELKRRVPAGLDTVYFTNSGTEGVETAIKLARCATGRPAIVYCDHAFHGLTTGSLALNGDETFRSGFAPFLPDTRAIPFGDLAALEAALAGGDVAAFVVEPIQGKGVNLPRPVTSLRRPSCAAGTERCSLPTKCRPASDAPAAFSRSSTMATSARIFSFCRRHCPAATCRWRGADAAVDL